MNDKIQKKIKAAIPYIVIILVSLLSELFLFNYKHWQTIGYKGSNPEVHFYGISKDNDVYTVDDGDRYLEITDINGYLKNALIEIVDIDKEEYDESSYINVGFEATDEGHSLYYGLYSRKITHKEPRSYYVTFHLYGKAKNLKIKPDVQPGQRLRIKIMTNVKVPIFFYWERWLFVMVMLLFLYALRPASKLHKIEYAALNRNRVLSLVFGVFIINAIAFLWITKLNGFYQYEPQINHEQYQKLAEAFTQGSLSILDEPTPELVNMENPYDMAQRSADVGEGNYYFDYAYFNGKYYVYFGVVPAVLIYLPYYLFNGEHIHNHTVCYIGILILLAAILMLFDVIIRKYYKKCGIGVWLLTFELTIIGSFLIYIAKRPDLYAVPIIFGLDFALLSMNCFLRSEKKDGSLNNILITLGSLCAALIAGCRPQLFLFFILDILIVRKFAFSKKYLLSVGGRKTIMAVGIPMVAVAATLMVYNFKRFGSPFDFGAYYNLTFNDMRNRGNVWDRVPLGIVAYLLRPLELSPEYPFFKNLQLSSVYMGQTIQEDTYGGLFMASPFSLLGFLSLIYSKQLKQKKTLWLLSISSMIIALVVIVFDIENAGIVGRYFFDFSLLFMLAAVYTVYSILDIYGNRALLFRTIILALLGLLVFQVLYQTQIFMLDAGDLLKNDRQDLFLHYYYLFEFGL